MEFTASDLQIIRTEPAPCLVNLEVIVPADKAQMAYKQISRKYAQKARVPGFRAGKIPAHILAKRYGQNILAETTDTLFKSAYDTALQAEKIRQATSMKKEDLELEGYQVGQEFSFKLRLEVEPEFELPEYVGVNVSSNEVQVGEDEVSTVIDNLREQRATHSKVERASQRGDMLKLSYKSTAPAELLENDKVKYFLQAENTWLLLQEPELLPGTITILDGVKAEEQKEAELTFPQDHYSEELRGKTFTYTFDIHEVQGRTLPELDEEFCKSLGVADSEELKKRVEETLNRGKQQEEDQKATGQILDALVAGQDFALPPTLMQATTQRLLDLFKQRAENRELEPEQLNAKLAAYEAEAEQKAARSQRLDLILNHIAQKEELAPSNDEITMAIANHARENQKTVQEMFKEMEKSGQLEQVYRQLIRYKTLEFLLAKANRHIIKADNPA